MPITEPPGHGTPLSQGDILKGIRLFYSKEGLVAGEESAEDAKHTMCLVLSRQCVVEHKKSLIVAGVTKYHQDISNELTFKEAKTVLETLRGGIGTPDLFYLGQLPGMAGRFCARLDSIHTIEIPQIPAERQTFIDEVRVAKLSIDFVRDLHMRVLGAFGNMGFEDYRWLSDMDLKWLVGKGESEIVKVQEDQKSAALAREAGGKPTEAKQTTKDQNEVESVRKQIGLYIRELERRSATRPSEA